MLSDIPFAWDREIKNLLNIVEDKEALEWILGKTAMNFYSIPALSQL
jgi:hypothetical protein